MNKFVHVNVWPYISNENLGYGSGYVKFMINSKWIHFLQTCIQTLEVFDMEKLPWCHPKDGEGQEKCVVLTMNTYFRAVVRISMNAIENINLKTDVKDKA